MEWKIPLSDIDLGKEEIGEVIKVLRSKWLTMGSVTQRFEEEFADYLGVKHAFGVANGTASLHLAHRVLDVGPGDEVIAPSLTFVAVANSVLYCGAKPVFADITGLDNLNISPDDIRKKITPKTKAITVVHYGGYPCEMKAIMDIAKEYNLKVIEDAAHAPGAEYLPAGRRGRGKKCGTIGDVGCFSFFANKNLVTGEGGMIVTNDDALAEKIRIMRSHGMTASSWDRYKGHAHSYDVVGLGYNYRIDEIRSAIGIVQLKKLQNNNTRRQRLVEIYKERLMDIRGLKLPFCKNRGVSSNHIFPILLEKGINRAKFMEHLKRKGIQTSIHYLPIHLFDFYRRNFGYAKGLLPVTEEAAEREVSLPLYPTMKNGDVHYICDTIIEYLRK